MHEYDKSIADSNEAIRLKPSFGWAYQSHRGLARYKQAEFEKAVSDFNEAMRLDPKDAWSLLALPG